MPTLVDFKPGDKVKVLGLEPSRNPDFPVDPMKGLRGIVAEVDHRDLIVWIRVDGIKPLAFEPWELEKL